MSKSLGLLVLAAAAFCTMACNKDKAPAVSTTRTTSAMVQPPPKDDYLATVKREQLTLRGKVDDELRAIEIEVAEQSRAANPDRQKIQALNAQHGTLEADLRALDRADERGWDELKAVIEHDVEDFQQ